MNSRYDCRLCGNQSTTTKTTDSRLQPESTRALVAGRIVDAAVAEREVERAGRGVEQRDVFVGHARVGRRRVLDGEVGGEQPKVGLGDLARVVDVDAVELPDDLLEAVVIAGVEVDAAVHAAVAVGPAAARGIVEDKAHERAVVVAEGARVARRAVRVAHAKLGGDRRLHRRHVARRERVRRRGHRDQRRRRGQDGEKIHLREDKKRRGEKRSCLRLHS